MIIFLKIFERRIRILKMNSVIILFLPMQLLLAKSQLWKQSFHYMITVIILMQALMTVYLYGYKYFQKFLLCFVSFKCTMYLSSMQGQITIVSQILQTLIHVGDSRLSGIVLVDCLTSTTLQSSESFVLILTTNASDIHCMFFKFSLFSILMVIG